MFTLLLRTIILYGVVILSIRLMGKRQIGELQPFELVITIMVSEIASLPMQDMRIPLIHGVIPVITLLVLQIIISEFEIKSEIARIIFSGKPSIIINNGEIDIKELRYQRLNMSDLLEELRLQGYHSLKDIQYAILETNGQISVLPKTETLPPTKKELNLRVQQEKLPITLIEDGKINYKNLKISGYDEQWLLDTIKKKSIPSPEALFYAMLDSSGEFSYQLRNPQSKGGA